MPIRNGITNGLLAVALGLLIQAAALGQGIFLPAGGAINRGMAGATTGTAVDAIGSMYWNPATISQLPNDELGFGFEAIYANYEISSTFPAAGSGSSDAEMGANPVPTIAWVHQTSNPYIKYGLGIFGVAGFSVNFRGDANNPILGPPLGLGGTGVGGIRSDAVFYQMNSVLSMQMTDRLSVAMGPIIGMAKITLDDNAFVALNADGLYPRGDGARYSWGLGAQLGIHYIHNCCWEFGASIKSPTWYEKIRWFSEDANGLPRTDQVDIDLPMIVSGGLAYKGFENAMITMDLRYLDYTSTEGFGDSASYAADGSANGLGWKDVFSLGLGAQFQLNQRIVGRMGYMFATPLFDDEDTFFNIASHLSYQHVPSVGATYALNQNASVSMAYSYLIEWETTGPYVLPGAGAVAGSSVTSKLDTHITTFGVNVRY